SHPSRIRPSRDFDWSCSRPSLRAKFPSAGVLPARTHAGRTSRTPESKASNTVELASALLLKDSFLEVPVTRILADDVQEVLVVLVADVLHQLLTVLIGRVAVHRKRLCIRSRILDGRFILQMIEISTPVALDDVQPLRVRVASEIEPESVVESNGIDNQRIAFPPANRVAVPGGIGVFGMLPTVEEDLAIAVDVALEQEEHVHPGLENAPRVRSLPRNAGRKALSLGIIFGHALACKLFGPGLERKFLTLLQSIVDVVHEIPIRAPDTGEVHLAFRRTRGGPS